jgi:signal peptidase I
MNSTEEQTAAQLRELVKLSAPATRARSSLAQDIVSLARVPQEGRRGLRRRTKVGISALAVAALAGSVAAVTLVGHGGYRKWIQPSAAMSPTVAVRQTVLVGKKLEPARGDVVLLEAVNKGARFEMLSRVVGLPGDTVSCPAEPDGTCKAVVVSGRVLQEPWLASRTAPFAPATVTPGHVFLLGDFREQAVDSRVFGLQRLDAVRGVVVARYNSAGLREPLPGTPPHELPDEYKNIDPAGPVPPAACQDGSGAPCS